MHQVVDTTNGLNVGIVCKLYETCFVCKMYLHISDS